jgi:hypothetical protein
VKDGEEDKDPQLNDGGWRRTVRMQQWLWNNAIAEEMAGWRLEVRHEWLLVRWQDGAVQWPSGSGPRDRERRVPHRE